MMKNVWVVWMVVGVGCGDSMQAQEADLGKDLTSAVDGGADSAAPFDLTGADLTPPNDLAPMPVADVVHPVVGVTVATLAGSAQAGSADGTGASARFDNPTGVALDASGVLYVTEYDGNRIRIVSSAGDVTSLTTTGGAYSFVAPFGIAIASASELVVQTDFDSAGVKSASSGTLWRVGIATGIPVPAVQGLARPRGLAALGAGKVAVSDHGAETVSTLTAPATALVLMAGGQDQAGYIDASGAAARFHDPYGVALLPDGNLLIADASNNRLRHVDALGAVTTLAGGPDVGSVDGAFADARFSLPTALAVDTSGEVFVSDRNSHRIRRLGLDGQVRTIAGDGTAGFRDGAGDQAQFYGQEGIAVSPDGKTVYVTDGNGGDGSDHHRIRVITIP